MPILPEVGERGILFGQDSGEQTDVAERQPDVVAQPTEKELAFRALQPWSHGPLLRTGRQGFKAPRHWKLSTAD